MRFLFPMLILHSVLWAQGKSFVIEGNIKGAQEGSYLYITHKYDEATIIDSTKVLKEKFSFKGKTPEPNMYWITVRKNENPSLIFFVDGGKVEISASTDSMAFAKIKAGPTQTDYVSWLQMQNTYQENRKQAIMRFNMARQGGNMELAQQIFDSAKTAEQACVKSIVSFIKAHPQSCIGGYAIWVTQFDWPDVKMYDEMYNSLSETVKKGKFGKIALDKINSMKGTTIGFPAIDFTMNDVNGKPVALSSFKGKYVLVDFWASWCGPCRRENPAVVAAYNKYKDKGFTIVGVSLDQDKNKWQAAIEADHLDWTQLSELKGWQGQVSQKYGVTGIPFNYLLDKEGNILAKGLRGEALESKLAEIFGQ